MVTPSTRIGSPGERLDGQAVGIREVPPEHGKRPPDTDADECREREPHRASWSRLVIDDGGPLGTDGGDYPDRRVR